MKSFEELKFKRLVIIAYRLPFKLVKKGNEYKAIQNAGGLVSAILALSEKFKSKEAATSKILWIGTGEKELGEENVNEHFDLFPISIPEKIEDKYYGGFCNDTIWPLFHYFPGMVTYDNSYFDAYKEANNLFLKKVKQVIQPGDLVWVHDYQLFFLPGLIRKANPEANIGFFLHIPFPSFEMFRLLPRIWREHILRGMLGADIVGFHTNDYTQHFLKSAKRTLGCEINQNTVMLDERIVKADAFPIGIDYDKFHNACSLSATQRLKKKLIGQLSGKKLIFSVDRLDYSKGFLFRLKAYEHFLDNNPNWINKVIFNMVVVPSRDHIEQYIMLKKEIEATVGRINGKYSNLEWRPIIYQYKSLSFNELVALYDISDIGLITPLRDGMNLVAKEYVACQVQNIGMLILSEMTGAVVELTESLVINPCDVDETSEAIVKALEMSPGEKKNKIEKMQKRLQRYNVFTWAADFFSQLSEIKAEQNKMSVYYLDETNEKQISKAYKAAKKRLLFLDYDGTLIPLAKYPEMAVLTNNAIGIIKNLSSDPKNKIIIISGRESEFLEQQFKSLDVTLIAEHGYLIKESTNPWINLNPVNLDWKEKIWPIVNEYVDRCNGSMLEEKQASIAWHYRNADPEIASIRINELKDDLSEVLKHDPKLQILEGNKVLEIKSVIYDKGSAASFIINNEDYDFIMAIGDDRTDEDIFKAMPDWAFTIKIGSEATLAKYNMKKQSQLYEMIERIIN